MKPEDLLRQARRRMDDAYSADMGNRQEAADDLRFLTGDQWPDDVRSERESEDKPCLTINGLSQFVRQVTGQIRDMNPAVRVSAADTDASKDVAEIFEGLIRQIEYASDASSIYEAAAESAAACGIGHWRIRADYAPGETFDQELMIERIYNPFSVFWDPLAKDPTRKDAAYCFIVEEIKKEDFEDQYPGKSALAVTGDNQPSLLYTWGRGETVTVAEYFWTEMKSVKIGLLPDGTVVRDPKPPMNVIKERTVKEPVVKWAKISGGDVLEGPKDFPCTYIPVVSVVGEEWHNGEQTYRSSVIRFAKDPQQLYNFARSSGAELIAMQPKAPYLITVKQVAGLETFWNTANSSTRPYLPYNVDEKAGAPTRVPPPVPSSGIMAEIQMAADDMKRTTGIYDASLGNRSNETSGIAIQARQQEAQNGTSIYADNMTKSVAHTGRILVSMIPKVYDTKRVVRTLGEDDQEQMVLINDVMQAQQDGMVAEVPINDMTQGRYDVRVSVGPSYQNKRQQASDGMLQFLQTVPQAQQFVADLIAGAQDWPDADRIAERLRKALPPEMQDEQEEEQTPEQQQAMAAQAQQQQAQQAAQQMEQFAMAEAQAKAEQAAANARKAQADADKAEVELALARMQAPQQAMQTMMVAPQGLTG